MGKQRPEVGRALHHHREPRARALRLPKEATTEGSAAAPGSSGATGSATPGAPSREERTGELDRKLDASLRELDGLLMEEQEKLAEAASSGGSGSSGGTSGGLRSGSGGAGSSGSAESGSNPGGETSGGATGEESGGAVGGGGAGGGDTGSPAPDDVGDGSDDDIVARQLREAAMAEDDPELRERLWQEYRDYKASLKNQSRSSSDRD